MRLEVLVAPRVWCCPISAKKRQNCTLTDRLELTLQAQRRGLLESVGAERRILLLVRRGRLVQQGSLLQGLASLRQVVG